MHGTRPPLKPGERAPAFTLPRIDGDGAVALADYQSRAPLLLAMFRGISCAFCRRALVQLDLTRDRLRELGIETLAIIATPPEEARLYFRYRPTRLTLGADPDLATHRAFGLPKVELPWQAVQATRVNPTGELAAPLPVWETAKALARIEGFRPTDSSRSEMERTWNQSAGEFLIDAAGVVRWTFIEYATGDLAGIGGFPRTDDILAAARLLSTAG